MENDNNKPGEHAYTRVRPGVAVAGALVALGAIVGFSAARADARTVEKLQRTERELAEARRTIEALRPAPYKPEPGPGMRMCLM